MNKKKAIIISTVSLFLIVSLIFSVNAFIPILDDDKPQVKTFKYAMNREALKNDISKGITEEGLIIKLNYFNG